MVVTRRQTQNSSQPLQHASSGDLESSNCENDPAYSSPVLKSAPMSKRRRVQGSGVNSAPTSHSMQNGKQSEGAKAQQGTPKKKARKKPEADEDDWLPPQKIEDEDEVSDASDATESSELSSSSSDESSSTPSPQRAQPLREKPRTASTASVNRRVTPSSRSVSGHLSGEGQLATSDSFGKCPREDESSSVEICLKPERSDGSEESDKCAAGARPGSIRLGSIDRPPNPKHHTFVQKLKGVFVTEQRDSSRSIDVSKPCYRGDVGAELLAVHIVNALDDVDADRAHRVSIFQNLKRSDNMELRDRLLAGTLTPQELVQMKTTDLAPEFLKKKRQEDQEKYFAQNVILASGPARVIRKTHKGIEEVEGSAGPPVEVSAVPGGVLAGNTPETVKNEKPHFAERARDLVEGDELSESESESEGAASEDSVESITIISAIDPAKNKTSADGDGVVQQALSASQHGDIGGPKGDQQTLGVVEESPQVSQFVHQIKQEEDLKGQKFHLSRKTQSVCGNLSDHELLFDLSRITRTALVDRIMNRYSNLEKCWAEMATGNEWKQEEAQKIIGRLQSSLQAQCNTLERLQHIGDSHEQQA